MHSLFAAHGMLGHGQVVGAKDVKNEKEKPKGTTLYGYPSRRYPYLTKGPGVFGRVRQHVAPGGATKRWWCIASVPERNPGMVEVKAKV